MKVRKIAIVVIAVALAFGTGCLSFETPRHDARFGKAPSNYNTAVKRHIQTAFDYPEVTRFKIGKPRKAYMNKGILLGGDILWAGYVVDVHVQSIDRGFRRADQYLVRLHDDEVVEVHLASNLPVIHEL